MLLLLQGIVLDNNELVQMLAPSSLITLLTSNGLKPEMKASPWYFFLATELITRSCSSLLPSRITAWVEAKVVHRVTIRVVADASTRSHEFRESMHSVTNFKACQMLGRLIAERSKAVDVYAVTCGGGKDEKLHGKVAAVIYTMINK